MIYCGDTIALNSIIEAVYLSEDVSVKVAESNIYVNPENPTYIINKVVIINFANYPLDKIKILLRNRCKVISRINLDYSVSNNEVEFQPYILRPCFDVMWNGKSYCINNISELEDIMSDNNNCWDVDFPDYRIFFPKLIVNDDSIKSYLCDKYGNLTGIGWLLQQVGVNISKDTMFNDLDIIKTKKLGF